MTSAVLTPQRRGPIIDLGNGRYRKQLLPLGSINYHGKKITFDRSYLTELVQSFKDRACGPIPFQLADDQNKHTNDPERRRGTIVDLEMVDDGLDALIELDSRGQQLIGEYPDLGVSARIYENYERSDGSFWRAALQHVLGTLDPHVTGMRPWQAVALSQDVTGPVYDLSGTTFDDGKEEVKPVATKTSLKDILAKLRENGDEAELTDEELDQLLAITDALETGDKKPDPKADKKADDDDGELTDEELNALIAAAEADASADASTDDNDDSEGGDDDMSGANPELIAATNQHRQQLELANSQLEQQAIELAAMRQRMDTQSFEAEQRTLADQFHIPPRITELARPLLQGDGHVIQLANGDEVDAGAIMRKVLVELGQTFKVLDLSPLVGLSEDEPNDEEKAAREQQEKETRDFIDRVKSGYSF